MRWRCGDCKGSLRKLRWAPMVHDKVWRAVACDPDRWLCETCLRGRMRRMLGRELRLEDLRWCPFNDDYIEEFGPDLKALAAADLPAGQSMRYLCFLKLRPAVGPALDRMPPSPSTESP